MSSAVPPKVLLVDDQVENLVALEAVLEPLGLTLVRATSGRDALGKLLREDFALILMDVQMPELDGFETAGYIKRREKTRHIPIIFLTAISKELHHVFRGYSAGAVDYVLKPFDPVVLRSKVAVFVDLYEKERALRDSERRFRAAFERAPIGIALMTLEGRFIDVNRALATMLDRAPGELLGLDPAALTHPDDRAGEREHMRRAAAGETAQLSYEKRFLRPRGEPVPAQVTASVVPDEEGRPLHVIAQVTDLTERRSAERERDRRQREESARNEAEAVAATLEKLQAVTDVALTHLGFEELMTALLPRVAQTLRADAAGVILLETDTATATASASGAALLPGGRIERGDRIPVAHEATRLAGLDAPAAIEVTDPESVHPLLRESGLAAVVAAPLTLDHGMRGVLQVGACQPRQFSSQEVALLALLADRAALAVRQARRYEHERGVVETLQRSLLPPSLPLVPGFTMAARYLPAEADSRVGGDWYDVVVHEGRVAVAIGDVSGHGIRAASLMGQLRNALRAYAFEGYPPAAAVGRLDGLVRQLESGWFATLAYATLEPEGDSLTLANAGHLAPLLVTPDGEARFLGQGQGSPLGTARRPSDFGETAYDVPPGSLLLFYTDGLVERRGTPLLDSLDELREVVRDGPREPEALCEHIRAELIGDAPPRDDVAFVAIRTIPLTGERLELTLPAEPKTLVAARSIIGRWLVAAGADEDTVRDLQTACHEACANVIEHAYRFREATFEIDGSAENGEVALTIRDSGGWRGVGNPDRGRGFAMMESLVDDLQIERSESGTAVTLRRRLERPVRARKAPAAQDGPATPPPAGRRGASNGTSRGRRGG